MYSSIVQSHQTAGIVKTLLYDLLHDDIIKLNLSWVFFQFLSI